MFFPENCKKINGVFIYLHIRIIPQILQEGVSVVITRFILPVQNNFSEKRWVNFVLLLLNSKFK